MFRFIKWIQEGQPVQLNGDGEQSRGFTFVDDIARGTTAALKPLVYEIFNLRGHEAITMNPLISILEELIGKKATVEHRPPNQADMLTNWADVSKARELFSQTPQVELLQGVRRALEWYRAEREWACQVV